MFVLCGGAYLIPKRATSPFPYRRKTLRIPSLLGLNFKGVLKV
jgi:hypothetical protein